MQLRTNMTASTWCQSLMWTWFVLSHLSSELRNFIDGEHEQSRGMRNSYFYVLSRPMIHTVQRAIELVKLAIVEDERHNYADAYKNYQNALDYFMLALKCKPHRITIISPSIQWLKLVPDEKNDKSKDLIKSKINEYLGRAEILKEHLTTERRGRNAIGVNGGGGATGAVGKQCALHSIRCYPFIDFAPTGTMRTVIRTLKQRNCGRLWQVLSYQKNQTLVGTKLRASKAPKSLCKRQCFCLFNSPISSLANGRHGEVSSYMARQEQGNLI